MKRKIIETGFWFCPVCGGSAGMHRDLQYNQYLHCHSNVCDAITEIKSVHKLEFFKGE